MKPDLVKNNPKANVLWDYYKGKLEAAGKWKDEYAACFVVLIDALVGYLEVSATLADPDVKAIITNPSKGTSYRNPLLDVRAGHITTIKSYASAFGLNPLADAKLAATPGDAIGDLFRHLAGPVAGA